MATAMKRGIISRLRNSFRSTVQYVHVPRTVVAESHPIASPYFEKSINPAVALTARGSVALSTLPVLSESDVEEIRKEVLAYDFSAD